MKLVINVCPSLPLCSMHPVIKYRTVDKTDLMPFLKYILYVYNFVITIQRHWAWYTEQHLEFWSHIYWNTGILGCVNCVSKPNVYLTWGPRALLAVHTVAQKHVRMDRELVLVYKFTKEKLRSKKGCFDCLSLLRSAKNIPFRVEFLNECSTSWWKVRGTQFLRLVIQKTCGVFLCASIMTDRLNLITLQKTSSLTMAPRSLPTLVWQLA